MKPTFTQQTNQIQEDQILSQDEQFARIKEICEPFYLTHAQLLDIKSSLLSEIVKGLSAASNSLSSTKCWPTFLQEYPCGCEHGLYLVLEIRDHNFHICLVYLKGNSNYQYEKETHDIPQELYTGYVEEFFDYLVTKLNKFLKLHKLQREQLTMALCFSFPLRHTSLKKAIVENLNKNLNIQNLVGKEVVQLLQDALNRNPDLHVHVETVLNNCTAILLANSCEDNCCNIGINVGHGFNAVYVEHVSQIDLCSKQISIPHMVINTEWGNFGSNGHLESVLTVYDRQMDEITSNKGQQIFEKLISGLYLGELARQIFLQCISEKVLFEGYLSYKLKFPFSFTSHHISSMLVEADDGVYDNMRLQFDKLGISQPAVSECSKVHYILQSIAQRSANLVACGIKCLSEKCMENKAVVGIGGSFYLSCSVYENLLKEKLKILFENERSVALNSLKNDVALGSALSAAISKSKEFVYFSEQAKKLSRS